VGKYRLPERWIRVEGTQAEGGVSQARHVLGIGILVTFGFGEDVSEGGQDSRARRLGWLRIVFGGPRCCEVKNHQQNGPNPNSECASRLVGQVCKA
jgi:hypothetical protein